MESIRLAPLEPGCNVYVERELRCRQPASYRVWLHYCICGEHAAAEPCPDGYAPEENEVDTSAVCGEHAAYMREVGWHSLVRMATYTDDTAPCGRCGDLGPKDTPCRRCNG